MWNFIFGLLIGFTISYIYGWMKIHYPESREMINTKVAKQRRERAVYELETEKLREKTDEILRRRGTG